MHKKKSDLLLSYKLLKGLVGPDPHDLFNNDSKTRRAPFKRSTASAEPSQEKGFDRRVCCKFRISHVPMAFLISTLFQKKVNEFG